MYNYHRWTYVSLEDVAQTFRLALDVARAPYQAFHIPATDGLNARPTLDMLRDRYGTPPEIRNPDYFRRNPPASVLDNSLTREVLGFEPASDWRRIVAAMKMAQELRR